MPNPTLQQMLLQLKSGYLDARGTGIRRFAELSRISRTKLKRFFDGTAFPTEMEVHQMSMAMEIIEAKYERDTMLKMIKHGPDTNSSKKSKSITLRDPAGIAHPR